MTYEHLILETEYRTVRRYMEAVMINFDEEIKKFHPSLEVDEAEDEIYNNNITDLTDIMVEIMKEAKEKK